MAFGMINKEIFYMSLKGIMHFMQIFSFNKLTTKIKKQLVILDVIDNL